MHKQMGFFFLFFVKMIRLESVSDLHGKTLIRYFNVCKTSHVQFALAAFLHQS